MNSKNDILNDDKDHNKTSENSKSKPSVSSTIKIENKDEWFRISATRNAY